MTDTTYYSKSKVVENRTVNYRFSVTDKKDQSVTDLRKVIRLHNMEQQIIEDSGKEPHYIMVRTRPRGPRQHNGVKYFMYTPEFLATHYDVYVVRDSQKMKKYRKNQVGKDGSLKKFITDNIAKVDKFVNGNETQLA
jgi:hypothetical protein